MRDRRVRRSLVAAAAALLWAWDGAAPAAPAAGRAVQDPSADAEALARIEAIVVDGAEALEPSLAQVKILRGTSVLPAAPALALVEDDEIITTIGVSVTLFLLENVPTEDKTVIVAPASQIRVRTRRSIFLILGRILADVRGLFDVVTPTATLGAQGTEFQVRVDEDGVTDLTVLEGDVAVRPEAPPPAAARRPRLPQPGVPRIRLAALRQPAPQPTPLASRAVRVTVSQDGAARPAPATEDHVREVLDWSGTAILGAAPTHAVERVLPAFESAEDRTAAFREARFGAIWNRDAEAFETLGNVYGDWGEGAKAVEAYGHAERADPGRRGSPRFRARLGEGLRLTGRIAEAEAELNAALGADAGDPVARNGLGNVYFARALVAADQGASTQAQDLLERCLQLYGEARTAEPTGATPVPAWQRAVTWTNDGDALRLLGDIEVAAGRTREARARLDAAERAFVSAALLDTGNPFATIGQAAAARISGDLARTEGSADAAVDAYRRAEARYREALARNPDLGEAYLGLGTVLERQGRPDEAADSYRLAAAVRPAAAEPYYRLGVLTEAQDPRLAARYYDTYLQVAPESVKATPAAERAARVVRETRGTANASIEVPRLAGLADRAARQTLEQAGLGVGTVTRRASPGVADGTVVEQTPAAGTRVERGRTVDYVLAAPAAGPGPDTPPARPGRVPKVEDLPLARGIQVLERDGYAVGRVTRRESSQPEGTILDQRPGSGNREAPGTAVDLVVATPRPVRVPDLVGDRRERAIEKLTEDGLVAGEVRTMASCEATGRVIRQEPAEDARVRPGTAVSLIVAGAGESPVRVPSLERLSRADAEATLRELGLTLGRVRQRETDRERPDTILDQEPGAGDLIAPGCPVEITVAEATPTIRVPNLVGMSEAQARAQLGEGILGLFESLRLGQVVYQQRRGTPGTVIAQNPQAGAEVRRGTAVDLVVVAGRPTTDEPAPVVVPRVIGLDLDAARQALARIGLEVGQVGGAARVTRLERASRPSYVVAEQSPSAGQRVRQGSAVDLTVRPRDTRVPVPKVEGMLRESAERALRAAGLGVQITFQPTDRVRPETVIRQSPQAGSLVEPRTPVQLVVASKPIG